MATIYRSKKTGEFGLYDDEGRFSWVDRETAEDVVGTGIGFAMDGEPISDDDPLWNDLYMVSSL